MTNIQVGYWANRENARHNLATETQARNELSETSRHNKVWEKETNRHNVRTERQTDRSLDETARHNKVGERIEKGKLKESIRHNKAGESISRDANDIKRREADAHIQVMMADAEGRRMLNELYKSNPNLMKMEHLSKIPNTAAGKAVVDSLNGLYAVNNELTPAQRKEVKSHLSKVKSWTKKEMRDFQNWWKHSDIKDIYDSTIGADFKAMRKEIKRNTR